MTTECTLNRTLSITWIWTKKNWCGAIFGNHSSALVFLWQIYHHYKVLILSFLLFVCAPTFSSISSTSKAHLCSCISFSCWFSLGDAVKSCLLSFSFRVSFCSVFANWTQRKWNHYQASNSSNNNKNEKRNHERIQCANQPIQQWLMDQSWPPKKCQNAICACLC